MPRPHVADAIGALLLCALWFAPQPARAECNTPAAFVTPGIHLIGYARNEAQAFLAALAAVSTEPPPEPVANSVLIVAYIGDDPSADVALHFFDAKGCSVG